MPNPRTPKKKQSKNAAITFRSKVIRHKNLKRFNAERDIPTVKMHVSKKLAQSMREVARRQKTIKRMFIEGFYLEAFTNYLSEHPTPKRIELIDRTSVRIQVNSTFIDCLNDLSKLAYKREVPVSRVIDDALRDYLSKPEHYLGNTWEENHPARYELLNKDVK